MCSMIGRFIMGTSGFGMFQVSGRSRVPKPPAMITAFIEMQILYRTAILSV